jgi:hypothetical protein
MSPRRPLRQEGRVRKATVPAPPAAGASPTQCAAAHGPGTQWQAACAVRYQLGQSCADRTQWEGCQKQQLKAHRTRQTTGFAADGGADAEKHHPCHPNPARNWARCRRSGLSITVQWPISHGTYTPRQLLWFRQASRRLSWRRVTWEMQHRRAEAFHELGGPLGAPSHQMLLWRPTPKAPFVWRTARNDTGPTGSSPSQRHQGAYVGRLPCVVAYALGPPSDQENFPNSS